VNDASPDFVGDISLINGIEAVPTILQVICTATGLGFAAVARVREGRWVACSVVDQIEVGLTPGEELPVENTIYDEIRTPRQEVVIDRAAERSGLGDPILAVYGIQSYISTPIILRDGSLFGALCASDRKPRRLNVPGTVGMFKLFAELIAIQIDSTGRLASSEANLEDERKTAELREQFVAILGHDLRNPLASIQGAAELLMKRTLDERSKQIVRMMRSSAARMSELINNVLDLTQARLGGGFQLNRTTEKDLTPVLEQVTSELRLASPECTIEMECKLDKPISCDRVRIAQLFSNLLGNACRHGDSTAPIRVFAETADAVFKLSVANSGTPIPALEMQRLFQPYVRGAASGSSQGLGLGLYIASEIARAHGGMLTATSSAEETRFTLRMPLQ
jgi:signal transduction histidine kinase